MRGKRRKMKGIAVNFYAIGLILMLIISFYFLKPQLTGDETKSLELSINNIVYMMRDSLDIAKIYLDNAARYSLYQAIYDDGANGGHGRLSGAKSVQVKGINYALWYDSSDQGAIPPTDEKITTAITEDTGYNFGSYITGRMINAIFPVSIPAYSAPEIANIDDHSLRLEIDAQDPIQLNQTIKTGDELTVSKNADIDMTLSIPYYKLYREALKEYDIIKGGMSQCSGMEKKEERFDYTIDVSILENTGTGCIVKFEAATKKKYLVWVEDKNSASMEPISFVFAARQQEGTAAGTTVVSSAVSAACASGTAERRIGVFGSSSTEDGRFVSKLSSIFAGEFTKHGYSGASTQWLLENRFSDDILLNNYNDVIIFAGVNDLPTTDLSMKAAKSNLQAMYSQAKAAGMRVIAVTIQPTKGATSYWTGAAGREPELVVQKTDELNRWIMEGAQDVDVRVNAYETLEEGETDSMQSEYASSDMLHLSDLGHQALADLIYQTAYSGVERCV